MVKISKKKKMAKMYFTEQNNIYHDIILCILNSIFKL